MLVKCWYCKEKVEKGSNDWTSYNGHNYHIECVEIAKQRAHFYEYINYIFCLKSPGPVIISQAKMYNEKYGYSFLGMERALRYWIEVKHNPETRPIEDRTIGIIPYVYNDAQAYYARVDKINEQFRKDTEKAESREKIIKVVPIPKQKERKPKYNIDEIE